MGLTDDRNDPDLRVTDPATGQQKKYLVLSEQERAKGFVRPLRRAYVHRRGRACGTLTRMGLALCETYARDPKFYGATFCCGCGTHAPVSEFDWDEDGAEVGS
jgi:hypothetical protein